MALRTLGSSSSQKCLIPLYILNTQPQIHEHSRFIAKDGFYGELKKTGITVFNNNNNNNNFAYRSLTKFCQSNKHKKP